MLKYDFDFEKTLQAAALVLRLHHGRIDRLRLLKILYVADRELLVEAGRPLTGDRVVAMKKGPVLSTVYDLIKGKGGVAGAYAWDRAFARDGYEVVLNPAVWVGDGELTGEEEDKLRKLTERFHDMDSEDLSELTHTFREWLETFDTSRPSSSYPIEWESVIRAQGQDRWVEIAEEELETRRSIASAFRGE